MANMFFKKRNAEVAPASPSTQPDPRSSKADDDDVDDLGQPAQHALTHTSTTRSIQYPAGVKLFLIMISVFVSMFLVALDRLIIATAVPQITDDFRSVTDIGWYGSAYLLTTCAFQLLFGKLYAFFDIKSVFMVSVVLFEIGSAICGAAPNSIAFIVGRAIAGVGGAGIISGVIVIMVHSVPLHRRPKYQGAFGAVFGIASVVGPLLGGAFTTKVTWRWCFYINLPLGGVALLVIGFVLRAPAQDDIGSMTLREKLAQLDFLGTSLFIPAVVCLLLALQWGGVEYAWKDGRIIALLVLAGVLVAAFISIQFLLPKTATVPPRIMRQRTIAFASFAAFCVGAQMMVFTYFLPIWFQAIQGVSAVDSGIRTLPLVLSMTLFAGVTGALVTRIGYYTPVMLFGTAVMAVGAGLLTTLAVDTGAARWAGYQVVYGVGMGMTFQAPNLAAQTVLRTRDVPVGASIMFFAQTLGGAVFISVGQNVLNNELVGRLRRIPGLQGLDLKGAGATTITQLPEDVRAPALEAYNAALRIVFVVGLVMVCCVMIGAAGMEWKSVKKQQHHHHRHHDAKKNAAEDVEAAGGVAAGVGPVAEVQEKALEAGSERDASVKETADRERDTASEADTQKGDNKA
ncbi:Efflux pump aflT [Colletotrichum orbiculare MAFF 240422]|uniref:Efflux pump aflT n=1 Tax=Colletotrichum orbiculare (strain 104-T / ATCC 96160 / CBS 514.97 / LARS 414 / MAFF 240422) TaxID=1213857 RepID=N4VNR7_COLOR|nr:Efflux pump aflT [Colletotrichum orbiculare MAFF 240422]